MEAPSRNAPGSQHPHVRTIGTGQLPSCIVSNLATTGTGLAKSEITPGTTLQQQGILINTQGGQKSSTITVSKGTISEPIQSSSMATSKIPSSPGPSPRKKVKLEEKPAANEEIAAARKLILDDRYVQMRGIKENYIEHLTECFYLQSGQNLMDFHSWKKRPTPQLVQFLKSGRLDSDDDEENPLIYLQEKDVHKEAKVLTSGSSIPLATQSVVASTTLSTSATALSNQASEQRKPDDRHGLMYGHINPSTAGVISTTVAIVTTVSILPAPPIGRTMSPATTTVSMAAGFMHRSVSDSKLTMLTSHSTKTVMSTTQSGMVKRTPPGSPGRHKQNSGSSDATNIIGITTQEAIVERAKQEAQVMSRVSELRKDGLWSSRRLPKVQEPPRNKAHWDYLLEEMQWLAADFAQERKWKKAAARKLAKMVQKHFQDLEQKELKAEKEEGMKLKRIAGQMAKMIKEFWSNIEKVVQYKQQSRLDEKRKKALDLHLNFIVDQTEKYSTWLTEGLKTSSKGSLNTTPASSIAGDDEFKPEGSESDDEETIDKDEEGIDETETKDEIAALQKESEVPLDELLESLPKEILEKPASLPSEKDEVDKLDEEFEADEDEEIDVEETIEEQERHERKRDVKQELDDLKDEGDLDIEALRAKYAAAYDSDFEMPEESEEEDDDEEETTEYEDSDDEAEETEEEEADVDVEAEEEVGLEALVKSEKSEEKTAVEEEEEEGPGKQLTDIAAQAASLQPKGYTLQTAEVRTKVPFLLKHTLREYQHVGLDWLATMFEKRLNGILADEMGLGKTIQTIALLAHLACEKGIWGPHLIVVPTSVMLNWEMEIKKWCPAFKILTYYGSQKERKLKRMGWTKTNAFHICITSYKLVIQDHQSFRRKKWKYLILDEAQNIKNFKSQRWQTLLNFNSLRRLLLTGTPLQNSLMELWSLMHFLMPQVFQSHREFKEWFANPLTGMIEGSHEYNEKLIHRLHKVLRPFLLRRLKDDVEKQMPKKYEHIVMCHLAKRQRFLYDEFMAQGKTKETLASGHFMSVINILMQLRKVCNHPSLFDPRPIVSPLQMEGLVYHTASMVLNALKYDPLEDIDIRARYPTLADMEKDLPAFVAHRVRKLQTSRHLIEEIDSESPPPPRPPVGKLKSGAIRCLSPGIPSGRASPQVSSRSVSPAPFGINSIDSVSDHSANMGTSQPPLQAKVLPQNGAATTTSTTQPATSQAITVQIQRTEQGTRFVVPSGFLQIVQTSSGQHLIATSSAPSSVTPVISPSPTVVNGEPVVTMATSALKTSVSSVMSQVKMSPSLQTISTAAIRLPDSAAVQDSNKPVMRVSPLSETVNSHLAHDGVIFTTASTSCTSTVPVMSNRATSRTRASKHVDDMKKLRKTEFFMESLYVKRRSRRKEQLDYIKNTNRKHCDVKPVYGHDLRDAVNIFKDPYDSKLYAKRDRTLWHGPGQIHCYCARFCRNLDHPKYLWNQTKVLSEVIHTPEEYLQELGEVLDRFVFVTPPVQCKPLRMHVSHPTPTYIQEERLREHLIHTELSKKAANYHKICTKMTVQFPELRLIQYDCGKLQTMDILLRRLKTGDHRVLIFTQMTKMLNILEAFLNYHGHRYLRLDGTTKVEQRQQLMDRFNADRRIFCFILSTRSGGIGVNLTGADTVIFYDSDWNPTMDAQAQDRCHRIGQTRDVHIYRLISERTVEENILKKANQKRMLGDMAIEGGNFTTTFFKEQTISELFSEPSGLDSLVKEKEDEEREKQKRAEEQKEQIKEEEEKVDTKAVVQFEKALAKTEDEADAFSAEQVKAEQKAELAEFDENIPWDEQEADRKEAEDSRVEIELALLEKELSPIERYAVLFAETQMEPVNAEELMIAEEDIVNAKKDWELNRLKALKEEEERRLELEEDEMLYTYSRDDAYQQVKKRNKQMVQAHRRAAAAAKADALSPVRKSVRLIGGPVDSDPEFVDPGGTPVLFSGKGRGRGRGRKSLQHSPSKTPKSTPSPSPKKLGRKPGKAAAAGEKTKLSAQKLSKKSKVKVSTVTDANDNGEEIDVETVAKDEETIKKLKKTSKPKTAASDKPAKKPGKRSPKIILKHITAPSSGLLTTGSTEATSLQSLPGYSSSNPIDIDNVTPRKVDQDNPARTNLLNKLTPVKSKKAEKPRLVTHDRGNIFEHFGQNVQPGLSSATNLLPTQLPSGSVRLINTQDGRQMVVVSSASVQPTQNLVLVQGMQGLPQGLILGNNILPIQSTPVNMATFTRGISPLGLSGARLQSSQQIISPQFAPQITPAVPSPTNQAFVQRLVNVQQSPSISGLSLGSVQQLAGLTIQRPPSQLVSGIGQINTQQIRLSTPSVQNTTVVSSPSQPTPPPANRLISPKKSASHTIADLIEARNLARPAAKAEKTALKPSGGGEPSALGLSKLLPNLSNIMKAQVPVGSEGPGKVRVNPTVAQLVASHINAAAAQAEGSQQKVNRPAIITASSTTRSASPTIVKLVAASSLRAGSPVNKVQTMPVQVRTAAGEPGKPQPSLAPPSKTDSPVATINIKGLPPGVTIPVFLSDIDNEEMPIWCPPTPPHDDNDVYIDETLHFLYDPTVMPETQLPPVYVKKEKKKIKVESINTRTQKQKRQEQPRVPRSLFDRPTAQLLKLRRDAKFQKLKQGQLKLYRPMPSMPQKPIMEQAPDHPEWLIHEDWALLQAVQNLFDVPLNLMIVSPAHTPNWDMVADVVNSVSRVYRSPKQCRHRYETVIIPREEGRILYDMNPRKQKKTKGIYKVTTKNNRPMKTSQIHGQDSNNGVTLLYSLRFDSVKGIATKRPPTMRQTLVNPTLKNPKHASVLQENSISYDHPLNPMQVAEIRAQRIQREKKQNQQQQQANAASQGTDQTAVSTAATVGQRSQQIATITQPQVSTATLVAVTSGVTAPQLATLGSVSSTATVLTVTGVPPIQTAVRQKAPIPVQEISSGITGTVPVATSQVRAQLQTGTTTVTTGLTQVQLAQRISAATTLASGATVQQQLQAAGKTLTPQQYQLLRNQTMLKQQQQQQALQQQQLRTMQRLTLVSPDQLKQQQLRQLKGSVIQGGQKTVIAQQLVTSLPQQTKQGQLKTTPVTTLTRPLTAEELARLKQQQLAQQQKLGQVQAGQPVAGTSGSVAQIQHHAQAGQLQTTQIIAAQAPVQQVAQNLGGVSQAATLVKTVSAPPGSVTIPVSNVNISVSMQQKGGLAKINTQQMKQMQLLQQRKQPSLPVQKTGGQKVGTPQMLNAVQIIQQQGGTGARSLTVQQLQQLMKQQPQGTIQQIIHTSQPTIIATVTQSQQQPQMVTKVVGTTVAATSQIQTVTATGTPVSGTSSTATSTPVISLSQVPVSSLNVASVAAGQASVTASIVKPAGGSEGVTTVQIHPVSSFAPSKLVGLPQNVVVQPIQQTSSTTTGQTHVTIPAQSISQHVTVSGTPPALHVTVPAPSQVQHVTVATPTQAQPVTAAQTPPQVNVTVVSHPSTPTPTPQSAPVSVTSIPATVTPSPVHTPTPPAPSPSQTPVTVTFPSAAPVQTITLTPTTVSTQPVTVSDQTVQQTVAAVLQPRQQPTVTVQQTTQAATTQIQTPQTVQTPAQSAQTGQAQQTTVQSPQSASKQAPYAMRTRKQSERQ